MLPSLVVRELIEGIHLFLSTTFPATSPGFLREDGSTAMDELLATPEAIFKGPYLSLGLPFRIVEKDQALPFSEFDPGFPPYSHQLKAFQRLCGANPLPTLVATGTGSGKTECFMYPILDHCANHPSSGIKAVVIYPMNALASDQARRFAKEIHKRDNLRGKVRVGLFVGDSEASPNRAMTDDFVITCKETQREDPPDILLTNYKMLDYLLLRPKDQPLWRHNTSDTLRYLVVDELHTFDGAQGTDLACLIRRLRDRLQIDTDVASGMACVGTSATIGGKQSLSALVDYASQVFSTPFDSHAIIREDRLSTEEFLHSTIKETRWPEPSTLLAMPSKNYHSPDDFIAAHAQLWFRQPPKGLASHDKQQRISAAVELGKVLVEHEAFHTLLKGCNGVTDLRQLAANWSSALRTSEEGAAAILDSLCALISAARCWRSPERRDPVKDGTKPFLQVRLQLWLRELRRLVASVEKRPRMVFADDLPQLSEPLHLPAVHCRECYATAWTSVRKPNESTLSTHLRNIYNAYFSQSPDTCVLFPLESTEHPEGKGLVKQLCPNCGCLSSEVEVACSECGEEELVRAWLPDMNRRGSHHGQQITRFRNDCPYCGARGGLSVMGSRAASLSSVLISHLFSSLYNDDHKLIAFSDSVQDAAHRAGFFGARTWRQVMRQAMVQAIRQRLNGMPLDQAYRIILDALVEAGVANHHDVRGQDVWSLRPDRWSCVTQLSELSCNHCRHRIQVPMTQLMQWQQVPCQRASCTGIYAMPTALTPPSAGNKAPIRLVTSEHTGLLDSKQRLFIENSFKTGDKPWDINLLSATPTMEMGIDIGDLSSVLLCSVPPAQANYLQRIGRAGRSDGNAVSITVANGVPHDLFFYAEPLEMMAGDIQPPGIFLKATAVLERQLIAYCFDQWGQTGIRDNAIPGRLKEVLDGIARNDGSRFPHNLIKYIQSDRNRLFREFHRLFPELDEESVTHLQHFLFGHDGAPDISHRLLNRLHVMQKQRVSLQEKIKELKTQLDKLKKQPEDEATKETIQAIEEERYGLMRLLSSFNGKQTLNFFTDEGLLPNYAFPEEGVTLHSVIYRKREKAEAAGEKEDGQHNPFERITYEFNRPAQAALSELAPESRFYGVNRRIEIDQIDLSVSAAEEWRLCNRCHYAENLIEKGDNQHSCPRCGSELWQNISQKQTLLKLKQVFANASDRESRIGDDSEQREPLFFNRQLLVDIPPNASNNAFKLEDESLPFGFEYLSTATFREVNFGQVGDDGVEIEVAGTTTNRPGFRICKHCGKVKKKGRPQQKNHSFSCRLNKPGVEESAADYHNALYLYRELKSEAVRLLLPLAEVASSDTRMQSLIAALHLGLKRFFGGDVSHLQITNYSEPTGDGDQRRYYLVILDTIPGGTGYLKDLLRTPNNLLEMLRMAHQVLVSCRCNDDPDKDGCYRCLYAYRESRNLEAISRDSAKNLIGDILESSDQLVPIDGLDKIELNALLEYELERRFIETLGNVKAQINLSCQIVNGKPGWMLSLASGDGQTMSWRIEPQVDLGPAEGVHLKTRPDFIFWPMRERKGLKPIAVYLDGFAYHQDKTVDDTQKRLAVLRSGQFIVWSLNWWDLPSPGVALDMDVVSWLQHPLDSKAADYFNKLAEKFERSQFNQLSALALEGPFKWLLHYLSFHVVEDELELKEMLEAPLEHWRVFLHPSQRKLVNRNWNGPVRVLGGAGTGKTVVAMHRAKWLVKNLLHDAGQRILFTTFTANLATDIENNLRKICTTDELSRIEVKHIDRWVSEFLKRNHYPHRIVYPDRDKDYAQIWQLALQLCPGELGLPDTFYKEEWERIILPQRVLTKADYFKASRKGRGVALSRKQRARIWTIFEELRTQLHQKGLRTFEDATLDAVDILNNKDIPLPYRSVIVDEAQDMGPEALTLIRQLTTQSPDDIFIVGDGHQRIYRRKTTMSSCGIKIVGRSRKLRINYRTTEETRRFAIAVLEEIPIDDLDGGEDSSSDYRSLMHGKKPEILGFSGIKEEAKGIVGRIQALQDSGEALHDICVTARTRRLRDELAQHISAEGVEVGATAFDIERPTCTPAQAIIPLQVNGSPR